MSSRFKIKEKSLKANRKVPVEVPEPKEPVLGDVSNLSPTKRMLAKRAHAQAMLEYTRTVWAQSEGLRGLDVFVDGPGAAFLRALIRLAPTEPVEIEADDATIVIEVKPDANSR